MMGRILGAVIVLGTLQLAALTDPPCVINLECEECQPDNMPLVTSHHAVNGSIIIPSREEVTLACAAGTFMLFPHRGTLTAICEAGRYRDRVDGRLRPLLELGCQESVFEDVLHPAAPAALQCAPPLQTRVYRVVVASRALHVAALCYDADRALPVRASVTGADGNALQLPPHDERAAPLSLLGNFNHMFDARTRHDAERLFGDEARLQRRLHEIITPEHVALAGQTLVAAPLLARHYFQDQNMRVSDFASNKVLTWHSVAQGNLHHAQHDISHVLRRARLVAHAGTHAVMTLRTDRGNMPLYLKMGRFPVPKYIWTVVVDEQRHKALAVIVLNDPFVAVSEIRDNVFCESLCGRALWARALRRQRRYETPLQGLTFCCDVHNFTSALPAGDGELLQHIVKDIPPGEQGLLLDDYQHVQQV